MSEAAAHDLGEEREVDLEDASRRIAARWWLLAACVAAGVVIGLIVAAGRGSVAEASTLVYLGEPFASGGQIQSLATNPNFVKETIRAEAVIQEAAADAGLTPGALRGHVSARSVAPTGATSRTATTLVEITVRVKGKPKARAAADSLAASITGVVSTYVDSKIKLLQQRLQADQQGLKTAQARIEDALQQLASARSAEGLSLSDRFLLQANANNTLQFWESRAQGLSTSLREGQLLLSLAENVERSRVVVPARAVDTRATTARAGGIVGGVIGLIAGAIAALAWSGRRQRAES